MENHLFEVVESITASFGIGVYSGKNSFKDLVNQADKNLYKAKQGGRNLIVG